MPLLVVGYNGGILQNYICDIDKEGLTHTPGWSMEALDVLIKQREIAAIGHKTLDTDAAKNAREKDFYTRSTMYLNTIYGRQKF